jgi:DNA mismatch endonuclease (patch repair protein)
MARTKESSRAKIMSSIRRRDTKIELLVRKELWKRGIRGYRVDVALPGRPDIYFPRFKLCIFIDGCFWHACPLHYKGVSTNREYWNPKIDRNKERDEENNKKLRGLGYQVKRFWDHEVAVDNGISVTNQIEEYLLAARNAST